jgi:large subunit ribosomal protein L10
MPRPEKVQAVADIKERLEESRAVFLAEYAGLSVGEQQELRRALRAAESEFKVVKMTLARLAAEELGHDSLLDDLTGPTGLAFASGDAVAAAKALKEFADAHEALILKGGLLGTEPLTPERVAELAELDSREVMLAKLAGAFQAPIAGMANLLATMPRSVATMLQQLIDKMPAEAAPAEEPATEPAAEAPEASEATTDDEPAETAEEE